MAQLAIAAAANIAIGLAINALFPPPDIEQEGPRLSDRGFTGTSHGKFINITFGTDRVDGTIIDNTDPAIEERVRRESTDGGKGGAPDVNSTTYTYFLTCRIAFGIEGADAILQLFADGKLIYDVTGSDQIAVEGLSLTFYSGGSDQQTDPEEVVRRGADIPAYTHLTTVKIDDLPLANFGNRIPNFTAVVSYNTSNSAPFLLLDEPASGIGIPSGNPSWVLVDETLNRVYSLEPATQWYATANALVFVNQYATTSGFSEPAAGRDGFAYRQSGTGNRSPLFKIDTETGQEEAQVGDTGLGLLDTLAGFYNGGKWFHLSVAAGEAGTAQMVIHLNVDFGSSNGTLTDTERMEIIKVFGTGDGLPANAFTGTFIPDHDRSRGFFWVENTSSSEYELHKMTPQIAVGLGGSITVTGAEVELVRSFTRGSAGDDFPAGTELPQGWAVNTKTGDLILSNDASIILYNPDTNTILATVVQAGVRSIYNYYSGDLIAFVKDDEILVYDTRDLTLLQTLDTTPGGDVDWPSGDGTVHNEGTCWNDRDQAVFISRDGSGASVDQRFAKVYVNRLTGDGVGLDFICESLATSYQRYEMAGLTSADVDVTTLSGDNVPGYTLNRDTPVTRAFDPLRNAYLFDVIQSDWIIKFPKRGQSPLVTIPENDIGELRRNRRLQDQPPIRESREDEIALPMSLSVRYRNKDIAYDNDIESDKRYATQNPTISTRKEQTLNIPVVQEPTFMKRVAQKWLWTLWNERVNYQTVLPWTYIALDPTDVFNLTILDEIVQIRMTEEDLAAEWKLGITGVVEDTKNASSTVGGGTNDGFNGQNLGSSLPTKLFFLDAPLLSQADILTTAISNAYVAFSAFEDSWRGGSSTKSEDNTQFFTTSTADQEAATAKVTVAPGAWGFQDAGNGPDGLKLAEDFPNRWQEIADGGSMTIRPLRRTGVWASATELAVLNGANTIAVITDAGVEVLQFVDATVNSDNTVTLSRLLRGRLGTEDIADAGGPAVNDVVILLADSTGVLESDPVTKQALATSELNRSLFFRGVTVGTLIEDAVSESFTYTGRDIKPFSVVHLEKDKQVDGSFDLTWDRRTRGPFQAEWLDGTGETPLNETVETYTIEVVDNAGTVGATKTVSVESGSVTALEAASVTPPTFAQVKQESGISGFPSVVTDMGKVQLVADDEVLLIETKVDTPGASSTGITTATVDNGQEGDLLVVAVIASRSSTTNDIGSASSDGSEMSLVADSSAFSAVIDTIRYSSLFTRVLTGSDPSDYSFTFPNAVFGTTVTYLLRFADQATPVDDSDTASTAATSIDLPSLTASGAKRVAISALCSRPTSNPTTVPDDTDVVHQGADTAPATNDEYNFVFAVETIPNAGATGIRTWEWASTTFNLKAGVWALINPA